MCLCVQDLPRPDCLMKPAEAMTEEELKIAKEFEQKEAELLEEREKYKKVMDLLSVPCTSHASVCMGEGHASSTTARTM